MKMDKSKDKPSSGTGTNNNNVPAKPKEKRRSNEKRKEKSRDAARCRRSRETEIFTELAHVLPIRREDVEQLDKASIMRLSIAFLKVREMLKLFPKVENLPSEDKVKNTEDDEIKPFDVWNNPEHQKMFTQALDGFLMILSSEGDVTYVSENISDFLGISQIDILGQQIWEYSHQCDHDELKEALNVRKNNSVEIKKEDSEKENNLTTEHRDFFLRLKCTLTSRGRSVNIKSASYKVIHVTGHLVMNDGGDRILIVIGRPLPHPSNIEIPLGSTTFLTKHSLDMKFTYVDDKMLSLLGYQPEDLLGKSLYDCHHGGDSESLMTTFKSVLSKGQGETCRHRFLGKLGGYCWIVTQATIVYDKQKPQSVVCVNYVISEIENNNEIYSCSQLEAYHKENDEKQQLLQQTQQQEQDNQQKQQNNKEKSDKIDNCCKQNIQQVIKHHQQQQQQPQKQQDQLDKKLSEKPTIINNNNNSNNLIKIDNKNYRESSLSPIRRTLNNCSISKSSSINSSIVGVNSVGGAVKISQQLMQKQEKRPKSVTASVFTQVRVPDKNLFITNSTTIPVATTAAAVNIAPKAQSVTASVFTPLSALPPNTIQNLPNRFLLSAGSGSNNSGNNTKSFVQTQRSGDMNKGYLPFSEDTPDLTMLKEEPDDLTHLAPTAGDACIPLDESTPLFGEMLENLMLPDSYALLPDDISSLDSQQSNCNNNNNNNKNQIDLDPFINYRDESSDTNSSPHLLSPGGASKSPEVSSLPSLCSPNSLSQEEEFAFMTMNVEDDIDLSMRAPYIPMNEQEDLPLLTDDLMWSAFSEELTLHKDIKEALQMESIKNSNNNNNNMNSNNTTTTGTTNSNDINNESSLAALLCSNSLQQQQGTDQISEQINDSNKKRKFDQSDSGTNLVDSIEAYGQAFSKNSTNDCWTMNDLLQINSAQNSTTLTHSNNIRPEKQSIIVNTVIPAQIHMPLITIQNNNNNNNNKDNICRTNSPAGLNKNNNKNSNNTSSKNNVLMDDNINRKFLTRIINTATSDGSIKNVCTVNIIGNGDLSNTIASNKRHLNTSASLDTKRVKNSSSVEMQTSPQLLQQLMAPSPQRQKIKSSYDKSQSTRWTTDGGGSQNSGNMSSSTPSNSVLKNLLVSGCDVSLSSRPPDIVMSDESSRDSIQDPQQTSPGSIYYNQPLHCKTSTVQLMRNFGSNPLIGGVGMLPSPPIPTPIDDVSPPGLISMNDCDSSSDSGIECNIQNTYMNERISKFSTNYTTSSAASEPGGCISSRGSNMDNGSPAMKISNNGTEEPPPTASEKRKMSFSFLDDQNPLCSPFLMELGNDDYEMNESINADFLQDNELTKVLSEWNYEMT